MVGSPKAKLPHERGQRQTHQGAGEPHLEQGDRVFIIVIIIIIIRFFVILLLFFFKAQCSLKSFPFLYTHILIKAIELHFTNKMY